MADGLEDRLRQIVVDQLGVHPDQVNRKASFIDDLGADSLDTGTPSRSSAELIAEGAIS